MFAERNPRALRGRQDVDIRFQRQAEHAQGTDLSHYMTESPPSLVKNSHSTDVGLQRSPQGSVSRQYTHHPPKICSRPAQVRRGTDWPRRLMLKSKDKSGLGVGGHGLEPPGLLQRGQSTSWTSTAAMLLPLPPRLSATSTQPPVHLPTRCLYPCRAHRLLSAVDLGLPAQDILSTQVLGVKRWLHQG